MNRNADKVTDCLSLPPFVVRGSRFLPPVRQTPQHRARGTTSMVGVTRWTTVFRQASLDALGIVLMRLLAYRCFECVLQALHV